MADPLLSVNRFDTFEALETAFRQRTGFRVPRQHRGLVAFWEDFRATNTYRRESEATTGRTTWITSNPKDCLAFGSADQVLRASVLSSGGSTHGVEGDVRRLAGHYQLMDHRYQPLRTLSGGETMRLALAKVHGITPVISGVTIASPYSWLSIDGRRYFDLLIRRLEQDRLPVEVMILEGEDSSEPATGPRQWPSGPRFQMRFADVRFSLGTPLEGLFGGSGQGAVDDTSLTVSSPCLLSGGNGEGKSLIARLMAGALGSTGSISIGPEGAPARARLMFQDVLNQTLMRLPEALGRSAGAVNRHRLLGIYHAIRQRLPLRVRETTLPVTVLKTGVDGMPPPELMTLKLLLSAARLCSPGGAIILDEPDWGLNRSAAIGLVSAVTAEAHNAGVPVVLISHKPWWSPLAASQVLVVKEAGGGASLDGVAFRLRLRRIEGK